MSLLKISLLCASALMTGIVYSAQNISSTVAGGINVSGSQKVSFQNGSVKMAANLYFPPSYDSAKKYPAIVVSHPWGGVKEQTAGLYAQQLAKRGFITLAYDASHYGESEGLPRDHFDLYDKSQFVNPAIDKLATSLAKIFKTSFYYSFRN